MFHRRSGRRAVAAIAALAAFTAVGVNLVDPAQASPGQVITSIEDGVTAEQLAGALVGEGVTISNVTYTGHVGGAGVFEGMGAIGFDSGVILSSGYANTVVGPNTSDAYSGSMGAPGDDDLAAITGQLSNDAAVLEFDFVPTTDNLAFEYVFGSEEYPEYVNAGVNDVFAFFVNGSNCALVGDPQVAVSIDTINADVNSHLYRANHVSQEDPLDTQLDGLTTVLTCSAVVDPGEVNHIKLAISDSGDSIYDSAVFIQAGSIRANTAPVAVDDSYGTAKGETLAVAAPGVLANDSDPDGDAIAAAVVDGPSNGSVTLGADGSFSYEPEADFEGTDSFTYVVSDGALESNVATVTIEVSAGSRISGVVTTPADAAVNLDGAMVLVYSQTSTSYIPVSWASIVPDEPGGLTGTYVLEDLPPGTYSLVFVAESPGGVTMQWAGGSRLRTGSTKFVITSNEQIVAAPENIVGTSTIAGTVTGDGAPVAGTLVMAYGPTDRWIGGHWGFTGADGTYRITSVNADDYRVYFTPPTETGYGRQWFSVLPNRSLASVVTVPGATTVSGIDATFGSTAAE